MPQGPFPPTSSAIQMVLDRSRQGSSTSAVHKDLQRMFARKISFDTTTFSNANEGQASLAAMLQLVVKLMLKTLVEEIRLTTFSRAGFQQMQVDCSMLRWVLSSCVEDDGDVLALLDEAFISCQERCLDCVPLEHAVIEALCENERQAQEDEKI